MQFKPILRASIAGLALMHGVAVHAATLDGITGGIFVSQGAGYQAVNAPLRLNPGDSVIANPGSTAKVVFSNGCVVSVQPGIVFTVPATSPCPANPPPVANSGSDSGVSWPLVAGGLAVVGGVGIALAAGGGGGGGGSSGPASP